MAVHDPNDVLRTPGRLVLAPTNLAAAFPYGGTEVGFFENARVGVFQERYDVISEAEGKRKRVILGPSILTMEFDLTQFDLDLLKKNWSSSTNTLLEPGRSGGSVNPGVAPTGAKLLFAAWDPRHPSVIFYNPAYCFGPSGTPLDLNDKRTTHVVIEAQDDASDRSYACDVLSSLAL